MDLRKFVEYVILEKHASVSEVELGLWVEIKDVSCVLEKLQELYTETRLQAKYDVMIRLPMILDTTCESVKIDLCNIDFKRFEISKEEFINILNEIDQIAHTN